MSQQRLHSPDILPGFQKMGGKGMPEAMRGEPDRQTGRPNRLADGPLEMLLIDMMPPDMPRPAT